MCMGGEIIDQRRDAFCRNSRSRSSPIHLGAFPKKEVPPSEYQFLTLGFQTPGSVWYSNEP